MPCQFRHRSKQLEILDALDTPIQNVQDSLDFMVFVNAYCGGARVVLNYFEKNKTPDKFTVLDLGSGSADIPYMLTRWAEKNTKDISVTAVDINPHCLAYAASRFTSPNIRYLRHSAFDLETLGSFDYIISSMFFHHLTDEEIVRLLKIIDRQSRIGFIVNDLYRCRRNYLGALLLSCFWSNKVIYHDAKLSVSRAFQEEDFVRYREQAGIAFNIHRQPLFRIVMSRHG